MTRLYLLIGMAALVVSGCNTLFQPAIQGSGNRVVEDRSVDTFHELDVVTPGEFTVTLGSDVPAVSLEIDDNLQPLIATDVNGDSLRIKSRRGFASDGGLVGTLQTDRLDQISVTGSSHVHVLGLTGEQCELEVTGSGEIVADGAVAKLVVEITGSGSIDLRDVRAAEVEVSITGSGSAVVDASESLHVSITGSGDVDYLGSPKISQSITGSGRVSALAE